MDTITVRIPAADASSSKMAKKGWKCWAKDLAHVNAPARTGYDYEGPFVRVGATAELAVGAVVLHVDDSSNAGVGVVCVASDASGIIMWMQTTSGSWAGALGGEARRLLALEPAARVREAAVQRLKELAEDPSPKPAVLAYWTALAGQATPPADEPAVDAAALVGIDLTALSTDALLAELQRRGALPVSTDG